MPLIGVVTPLYPLPNDPYRGQPIYETIRALERYADVQVICPLIQYPGSSQNQVAPDPAPAASGPQVTYLQYPGVPLFSRPFNGAICARHIYPYLKKLKPDVVLGFWLYPEGYASLCAAHALGIPAVVSARGSDLRRIQDPVTRLQVSRTLRQADFVLTVSQELQTHAVRLGATPQRTRAIRNGCDHRVFRYRERSEARKQLGLSEESQIVLYVGRLTRAKGILDLNTAFAVLNKECPQRQLVYVGTGPLHQRIERWAHKRGLGDRITLVGAKLPAEIALWMQAADVFCLPSYSEGCPNVVIEAISSGCPVVGSSVGGLPELLTAEAGLLTAPGNLGQLTASLRTALSRDWDRSQISRSLTRTWDDVAKETLEVCSAVAKPRVASRPATTRSSPMKITLVTPYFPTSKSSYRGHSAFHTINYLKELADVEVVCPLTTYPRLPGLSPKRFDPPDSNYEPPGIETSYVPYPGIPVLTRPINGLICEFMALPYVRASKPDVILNYWLYPEGFAAVRLGRRLGVPVVVGSIGSDLRRIPDPVTRHLIRMLLRQTAGVITVSEDLRRRAIALGAAPENVTTIVNGCETSLFYPGPREEARRNLGCDPAAEVILYVGTLLEGKGLGELADAFAALAPARPAARLVLIGEGAFGAEMARRIENAGLSGRVQFQGRQPSAVVSEWMRAADVFCLPSYSEGCPNVVVEAIACGRPVVATNVGGIPEMVREHCGILVPARAVEPLVRALADALSRNWDAARIAGSWLRGWDVVARETFDVCCRAVEQARRQGGSSTGRR